MPTGIFITLFGYLLGSVPTGIVLTRLFSKVDPRKMGSRNIGATNIYRTAGKLLGILTLVGDVLKGVIPTAIAMWWGLTRSMGTFASRMDSHRRPKPIFRSCFPDLSRV